MPTPQEVAAARAKMANAMAAEHNAAVIDGRITSHADLIPVAGVSGTPTPAEILESQRQRIDPTGSPEAPTVPAPQSPQPVPADGSQNQGDGSEKVFGKYLSLEEAEKGYYHAVNTLSTTQQENEQLRQQLASFQGQPSAYPTLPLQQPGQTPRVDPTAPKRNWAESPAVRRAAEETGIDPSVFVSLAEEIHGPDVDIQTAVQQAVQATLQPLVSASQADMKMRELYPEHEKHLPEIGTFLGANPRIRDAAIALKQTGRDFEAQEYVWNQYQHAVGIGQQNRMLANAQVAEEERQTARAAAHLPSSPSTPVHAAQQDPNQPSTQQVEEWRRRYQAGDQDAGVLWRRATLGHLLPPSDRTWEQNQWPGGR